VWGMSILETLPSTPPSGFPAIRDGQPTRSGRLPC
jgi:hypothetical protein